MATRQELRRFQKTVWDYYREYGRRTLPWRNTRNPYRILVSEIMLQQTQVDRVVPKYEAFLKAFPKIEDLANATNVEVLALWSGLGYNRRALYLKRAAEAVVARYGGTIPKTITELEDLPGVGPYTARAIATFSQDRPYTFIETNIRSVFIAEFFPNEKKVSDALLFPLIEQALDAEHPRDWYYALMDYGVHLKKTRPNPSRSSKHHSKQSTFRGSVREVRGHILRECLAGTKVSVKTLAKDFTEKDIPRIEKALATLLKEGVVTKDAKGYITIT